MNLREEIKELRRGEGLLKEQVDDLKEELHVQRNKERALRDQVDGLQFQLAHFRTGDVVKQS